MIFTPLLLLPSPKSVSLFGIYFLGAYLGQSFAVPTINMPEGGSRADPNFGLYERLYDSYHGRGGALYIRGYQQKGSPPPEVRGDGGSGRFFHPRLKSKVRKNLCRLEMDAGACNGNVCNTEFRLKVWH